MVESPTTERINASRIARTSLMPTANGSITSSRSIMPWSSLHSHTCSGSLIQSPSARLGPYWRRPCCNRLRISSATCSQTGSKASKNSSQAALSADGTLPSPSPCRQRFSTLRSSTRPALSASPCPSARSFVCPAADSIRFVVMSSSSMPLPPPSSIAACIQYGPPAHGAHAGQEAVVDTP